MKYEWALSIAFIIVFLAMAGLELAGHPIDPSKTLACSIWAFGAAAAQVVETIVSLQDRARKNFQKMLPSVERINVSKSRENIEEWFDVRRTRYVRLGNVIWFFATVVAVMILLGIFPSENHALSNGLAFASIALFFASTALREEGGKGLKKGSIKERIKNGKNRKQGQV